MNSLLSYRPQASRAIIGLTLICLMMSAAFADVQIFPTQTAKLNDTGAFNGIGANFISPITYTWYAQCPACAGYNALPSSNTLVYYWVTAANTAYGNWNVIVGGVDATGANVANSVSVNVIILNPASGGGSGNSIYYTANALSGLYLSGNVFGIATVQNTIFTTNIIINGANALTSGGSTILVSNNQLAALPFGIGIGLTIGLVFSIKTKKGRNNGKRNPNA